MLSGFVTFILFNLDVLLKPNSPLVVVLGRGLSAVKVEGAKSPSLSLKLAKSDSLGDLMLTLLGIR